LHNVTLDFLLVATLLKHLGQAVHTTHTGAETSSNFGRMNVLIEFIGVRDTGVIESLSGGNKRPDRNAIGASSDVLGDTVASSVPPIRELAGNETVVRNGLGDEDPSTFLQLNEPLATLTRPDVALVAMLLLEFLGI
jgi:hypothetical protein